MLRFLLLLLTGLTLPPAALGALRNATVIMLTPRYEWLLLNNATSFIRLSYQLRLEKAACCPGLHIFTKDQLQDEIIKSENCFPAVDSLLGTNRYYTSFGRMVNDHTVCLDDGDFVVCEGKGEFSQTTNKFWYVALAYRCSTYKTFNTRPIVNLRVDVQPNHHGHCESLQMNEHFQSSKVQAGLPPDMYNSKSLVYFPNVFGMPHVSDLTGYITRQIDAITTSECHQHLKAFMHLTLYPACKVTHKQNSSGVSRHLDNDTSGTRNATISAFDVSLDVTTFTAPCRKMCLEFSNACSSIAELLQSHGCDNYPSTGCFYERVRCPLPPKVPQATLSELTATRASYSCHNGTELTVQNTDIYCLPSGRWSQIHFSCQTEISEQPTFPPALIVVSATACVFLVLLGSVSYYYRKLLMFLLQVYVCKKASTLQEAISGGTSQPKVFLTYSSLDRDRVEELKSELTGQLRECQVVSYEEDFVIGQRIVDCIREAVWQSEAAILYLTQNYLESEWCQFEFNEAHLRRMRDKGYRIVIITEQDVSKLTGMQKHLELYLKSHIYLRYGEKYFWPRLRKTLLS